MQATFHRITSQLSDAIHLDRRIHLFKNDSVLAKRAEKWTYVLLFVLTYAITIYLSWCTYYHGVRGSSPSNAFTPTAPPTCQSTHNVVIALVYAFNIPAYPLFMYLNRPLDVHNFSTLESVGMWIVLLVLVVVLAFVMVMWMTFLMNLIPVIISVLIKCFRICALSNIAVHDNCSALEVGNNRNVNEMNKQQ